MPVQPSPRTALRQVYRCASTLPPPRREPILDTIRAVGADLQLVNGHIGDAGKAANAFAASDGYFNVATLREPYRAEGNKTLGYELAEQLDWRLPDVIVYPTGGGEGVIGMWKAFGEMVRWGWLEKETRLPRIVVAQADGCAPLVRAFRRGCRISDSLGEPDHARRGATRTWAAWATVSCCVPSARVEALPGAASEDAIREDTRRLAESSGIDAAPEGGCALAVTRAARQSRTAGSPTCRGCRSTTRVAERLTAEAPRSGKRAVRNRKA